jgi:hypothetical protein
MPSPASGEITLFTKAQYGEYYTALSNVITRLEGADIRVPLVGRLRKELRVLQTAATGSLPTTKREQVVLANAMADAFEFHDIIAAFGDQLTTFAAELRDSMKGKHDDRSSRAAGARFQSQLWLGSVLKMGRYEVRIPTGAKSRPDFLVEEGISTYGVEVKRPDTVAGAKRKLKEGASQLRSYGVAGAVIMDLSEAVGLHSLAWSLRHSIEPTVQSMHSEFADLDMALKTQTLNELAHQPKPGYEGVVVIFSFARSAVWIQGPQAGITVVAFAAARSIVPGIKNVRYYHATDLNERIVLGLNRLGFPFEPFRQVAVSSF